MKIKPMKRAKVISGLVLTLTAILTFKQANAQSGSSYVTPPYAPSNWIINPANPIYYNPYYTPVPPNPEDGSNSQSSLINSLYEEASDANYREDYVAAFQLYTKIIKLDPLEAQAYFNRGGIRQSEMNDLTGAERDFRIAEASIERIQQLSER
jgi:hypothetical protein